MDLGRGPVGWLYDRVGGQWFADSVVQEVDEIARLLEAGERGHGVAAHDDAGASQPREPPACAARPRRVAPRLPRSPLAFSPGGVWDVLPSAPPLSVVALFAVGPPV